MKLKGATVALDTVDLRILDVLEKDARLTYTEIGKRVGLAHSTVYDRVRKMEQYGIIKGYTTIIDSDKFGAKSITAVMTIFTDPKESDNVAEHLCKAEEVHDVYTSLSEELSIIAKVVAENQERLHEFIAGSIAPLRGVLRIRTSIITKKFKEDRLYIVRNPRKAQFINGEYNKVGEGKN